MKKEIFTISKSSDSLEDLESFDSKVFVGDEKASQKMCSLILAFALFCDDLKDTLMFNKLVKESEPKNTYDVSPAAGQYNALLIFIQRMYISRITELSSLIKNNRDIIECTGFQKIIKQMSKEKRDDWQEMVEILTHKKDKASDKFDRLLTIIRHKVGSHYDIDEIFKGYEVQFIKNQQEPYISRGTTISEARFYFADAAALSYYYKKLDDFDYLHFDRELTELMEKIIAAIWPLVCIFINSRSSWKEPTQKKLIKQEDFQYK